jgi:hypothetical protein
MTIDQCCGKRLLHGIQEQATARKPGKPFHIHCLDERTHSGVHKLRGSAQFYIAVISMTGGQQRSVRKSESQQMYVVHPNPLFDLTAS